MKQQDKAHQQEPERVTPELLKKIPLLANLSPGEVDKMLANLVLRQYPKRQMVIQKGAPGDSLMFLVSGQLQVVDVTEDGRDIGLRILKPGDFFGEIAVITGSTRSASVVALTQAVTVFLPRSVALWLFANSPPVAEKILCYLAEKIQRDSEFRSLLSIQNTFRRVYALLDQFRQKQTGNGPESLENLPTHQDMAIMINTSRETVSRALSRLMQAGIVEKDGHRLIIRKPAQLQQMIRGEK